MEREENNLFKYATKELSQDAFICWCINFINYPDNKLYGLGKDFLKMIVTDEKGKSRIKITNKTRVKIFRQYEKIDILLVVDNKYLVIIEDKINSFNHGQLTSNMGNKNKVYKYKLVNLLSEYVEIDENGMLFHNEKKDKNRIHKRWNELGLKTFENIDNIIEVYIKSGIITALDNGVHAIKIDTNKMLNVFEKYISDSETLKDFYECLNFKVDLIDEKRVKEIIDIGKIKIGTKFRYRAMCYNCFYKTTNNYYTNNFENNMNLRMKAGGMELTKNVCIWIPKLFKQNNWVNTLDEQKGIIIEENLVKEINEKNVPKYKYIFVRRIDEFSDEYFEFIGVYKLLKYKNNYKRIWKKINTDEYVTLDVSKYE